MSNHARPHTSRQLRLHLERKMAQQGCIEVRETPEGVFVRKYGTNEWHSLDCPAAMEMFLGGGQ